MTDFSYIEVLKLAAPETILAVGAILVLFLDLVMLRGYDNEHRSAFLATVSTVACVLGVMALEYLPRDASLIDGILVLSPMTILVKQGVLVFAALTALISWRIQFTEHVGEYFALILFATIGMMFLSSTEHLLMLFVSLELTSLSLYVLVAFNKESRASAEAALKYFLFGGVAAAFTLFGLSLIYGLAGSLNLPTIAENLSGETPGLIFHVAVVMALVGFGFKVAVAPFHLWAPDAYQGAPTPAAAFIASGSKVASFYILAQVLYLGFGEFVGDAGWGRFVSGWQPVLAIFAVLSMVIGNLAALAQTSVKRLLAYSAIAHGGYALVAVMANSADGLASLVYYVVTYGLATLGAFAVVGVVEESCGDDNMDSLAGLKERSPVLAVCLMVFILSSAGIPPLAGFFGKFYAFTAGLKTGSADIGLIWVVAVGLVMSAVSFYYYLQVLKRALVMPAAEGVPAIRPSGVVLGVVVLLAVVVVLLGCVPTLLLPETGLSEVAAAAN